MGITSQREVKELSNTVKLSIILSIIMTVFAVILYISFPNIMAHLEKRRLEKDIESVECVFTVMQDVIDEGDLEGTPSGLWDMSLSDFSQMSTLENFNNELCKRLNVSSLSELEGYGFKSRAFKGSQYIIYMYDDTKELHIKVPSNDPDEHEDIVY